MSDYEKAMIDLENRKLDETKQQNLSTAFDRYRTSLLGYADKHKYAAQFMNRGFMPPVGGATPVSAPIDPEVTAYYAAHPELGPAPGTGTNPHLRAGHGPQSIPRS